MHYNIDSCNYTNTSGNKGLTKGEVEIKEEVESKDLIPLENVIKNEQIEMIQTNNDYENFKLKNEEVDLKFECDADLSTHECKNVDFGKEISSGKSYMNSVKEEKEHEINVLVKNFKCTLCSKAFIRKINLDKHLLKIHNCENIKKRRKLYNCDQCSYKCVKKRDLLRHKIKHGIIDDIVILKCYQCTYQTYHKDDLIRHVKIHQNIKNFKCTLCLKAFNWKFALDDHLLKIHKCRNNVKKKLYNCDQCSYECLRNSDLLRHKIKHRITDGIPILKCCQCTYQTYRKEHLNRHVKIHKNINEFKCKYCSKKIYQKSNLDRHLLRMHNCKDVRNRRNLYNCDQCSYECLRKSDLSRHKIKHNITDGISIMKCYECTYQTYRKDDLIRHVKIHQNIKEFKCTLCSKSFTQKINLDNHLYRIHKSRNVGKKPRKKLYNCDQCSFESLRKNEILRHKIKHGITDGIPIFKCYNCSFESYLKSSLINHVKIHRNTSSTYRGCFESLFLSVC